MGSAIFGDLMRDCEHRVFEVTAASSAKATATARVAVAAAGVDGDVVVAAGVAAKVSTSDGVGRLSSELLELCEATFRCAARKVALAGGVTTTFAFFSFRCQNTPELHVSCTTSSTTLRKGAASNAIGAPLSHIRYQGGWATNSDVVLDYIDPNVLPSPGAWFFFGHIAPLRHFQVQQDSAKVAVPVPPS
eukprot:jgi/Tetstr1/437488/TSEL_026167.t1